MTANLRLCRVLNIGTGVAMVALFCSFGLQAQTNDQSVSPSAADYTAANDVSNIKHHAWPANTSAAQRIRVTALSNSPDTSSGPASARGPVPDAGGARYPGDLSYHGGAVVVSMQQYAIYLHPNGGCSTIANCWGDPEGFLRDLGQSEFIHVVDQYVDSNANNRYGVAGVRFNVNYIPPSHPFTDADMRALVHAVASQTHGTGYGNEYHIFLPPGQDECFDSTFTVCYSPDNLNTFFFCAYHGSFDFRDIGHVLYSVEPFQDVFGCQSRPGTPNGQLADSTNNVLSHEVFETITDPDGTAWWNSLDNGLFGEEIGDECSFLIFIGSGNNTAVYFDPSNVTLNGKDYVAQPEYNNTQRACTTRR